MEQQAQSNRRQRLTQDPQPQQQSPDKELPKGSHYKDYPDGSGRMIIRDNFEKASGAY